MRKSGLYIFRNQLLQALVVFVFLCSSAVYAQVTDEEDEPEDSIKTGVSLGRLAIKNPPSVLEAYTYDPVTDRYVYTSSVEGFNISYPIILTPKEYEQLVLRESMRNYFKKKGDAMDGKKEGSEEAKRDLL